MTGWTSSDAQAATGGKISGPDWQASAVSIDSRTITQGELFVAVEGERFDGHEFVAKALEHGAAAAMVTRVPSDAPKDASLLKVSDTLQGLCDLAKAARARTAARVAAITGSVGKTSAKEMLACALSTQGPVFFSRGNFNNHIGLPLNLANLPPQTRYGIFELGMNHAGEITPLAQLAQPDVALITTIEAVHLEFFDSVEGIADAKAEIFSGLRKGGVAVLPFDSEYFLRLEGKAREAGASIVRFGQKEGAEFRLLDWRIEGTGAVYELSVKGRKTPVKMKAVGKHWGQVAAGVLAMVEALGADMQKAIDALGNFSEVEGRGTLHEIDAEGGAAALIDDSYNASPASMRAAFEKLALLHEARNADGRTVAVLGDMLELGEQTNDLHSGLAQSLQQHDIDVVFTAGPLMRNLYDALPQNMRASHADSAASLLPLLKQHLAKGDTVLVKGSHGSRMYELARTLKAQAPVTKEVAHAV